jgi:S1-C subfamily serine protease
LITDRKLYLRNTTQGGGIAGKVLAREIKCDLALVKLAAMPPGASALPLAKASVSLEQIVYSMGNPSAQPKMWRFASWKVSSLSAELVKTGKEDIRFQLKTALVFTEPTEELAVSGGPGASGGPFVNDRGELVGVCQGQREVKGLKSAVFVDVSAVKSFLQKEGVKPKVVRDKEVTAKTKHAPAKPAAESHKEESIAKAKLNLANMLAAAGKTAKAKERYQDIIAGFPNTKAAEEARRLLAKLKQ